MRYLLLTLFLSLVFYQLHAAEKNESPQPIGYLRAELSSNIPLHADGYAVLRSILWNVSTSPCRITIDAYSFQPWMIEAGVPTNVTHTGTVWGLGIDRHLPLDIQMVEIRGMQKHTVPDWPARSGIELLPNEGYARIASLAPHWIKDDKALGNSEWIALRFMPAFDVETPMLKADAVRPNQLINWDKPKSVYVPASRCLAYSKRPKAFRAAEIPSTAIDLIILPSQDRKRGDDIDLCYLVGNTSKNSLWIDQQSLTPAFATWSIQRGTSVIATIDGSALAPLAEMAPKRPPLLLNPGEYLAFTRTIPFKQLNTDKSLSAKINLSLTINTFGNNAKMPATTPQQIILVANENIAFER